MKRLRAALAQHAVSNVEHGELIASLYTKIADLDKKIADLKLELQAAKITGKQTADILTSRLLATCGALQSAGNVLTETIDLIAKTQKGQP